MDDKELDRLAAPNVPSDQRGAYLLKLRTLLELSPADVATMLGVTTRTISSFESGKQKVSDARWRHFVLEVAELRSRRAASELVVVLGTVNQSGIEQEVPIDVVSQSNYVGYAISTDGQTGVIASTAVDRATGRQLIHRQQFDTKSNSHVIAAVQRWEALLQANSPDRTAFELHRWLTRRALAGELATPGLTELKAKVAELSASVSAEAHDEKRAKLQRQLDQEIANLIELVANSVRT